MTQGTRITREGQAALALVLGIGVIALQTGNNLVYMVIAVLMAVLVMAPLVATWNLRGVSVSRQLPEEFYAGHEARGALVIRNQRRYLPAVAVRAEELDLEGTALTVAAVDPQDEVFVPVGWRFGSRGNGWLGEIRVSSTFPFGLFERWRVIDRPASLVVFARPRAGMWSTNHGDLGADQGDGPSVGAFGDFAGLREYVAGDPLRSIHWRTTARVGYPVVLKRAGEGVRQVIVKVADRRGRGWETEIGRATGQIIRAFGQGCAVGLELPDRNYEPRDGNAWRRDLLEALATLPARE